MMFDVSTVLAPEGQAGDDGSSPAFRPHGQNSQNIATQKFARHKKAETTSKYVWIRKEEIDAVIERMEAKPLKAVQWNEIVRG